MDFWDIFYYIAIAITTMNRIQPFGEQIDGSLYEKE